MREYAALLTAMGLLFFWSIPDVIALRHLLMLFTMLLLASLSPWRDMLTALRTNRLPLLLLALLTAWLAFQAVFVSRETIWALGELRGQWLKACLALVIGIALATLTQKGRGLNSNATTTLLAGVLFVQVLIALGQSIAWWFEHGALLRQIVPLTGGKLEMSYIINILLAALAVDLLYRAAGKGDFLRVPGVAVLAALVIALASGHLAGARNGILGTLFLSLSCLMLYSIERHGRTGVRSTLSASLLLICLITAFAIVNIRADQRWATFGESARLGWDIDSNRAWVDSSRISFPTLGDGSLDTSAYLRVAFIRASLRLIDENPLGVGYGRNAFAHALRQTEAAKVGHAHSGLMDLGIGGGIPAIALWVAFIASLVVTGWQRYSRNTDPHGLLLLLIATGYMGRMLLDSVNRDHMLQIFMFLVGYLLAVAPVKPRLPEAVANSSTPPPP